MLHLIRRKGLPDRAREPAGLLRDCHDRMRSFVAVASRLAKAIDAPATEVAEAATRLSRYFALALPLHEEDEERSLAPRLLALDEGAGLQEVLATMVAHHERTHTVLASLGPLWERAAREPHMLGEISASLDEQTRSLGGLLEEHLSMEERHIFPFIHRLADAGRREILHEMRARREGRP